MKRIIPLLILAFVLSLGAVACSNKTKADEGTSDKASGNEAAGGEKAAGEVGEAKKQDKATQEEAVPVELTSLGRGAIEEVLRFSTNLEAEEEVQVFSQASQQVAELRVEEGDRVRKGEILLRLLDDEKRTNLDKVKSQLKKAVREHERQKRLYAEALISEEAFNQATYEVEQLELALEEAKLQLAYTEVRAPISGTVTERLVSLGDYVTLNQHLFDIVDFDSIVARIFVPEKELVRLRKGLDARVSSPALGNAMYEGKVDRIAPVVDPRSGTVKVTVALPAAQRLKPGMYVDVALVAAVRKDALLVPKKALIFDQDQIFVFRLKGEDRVERVAVVPELEDKEWVNPRDGLGDGDRVVVAGQAGLKEGAKVRLAGQKADQVEATAPAEEESGEATR